MSKQTILTVSQFKRLSRKRRAIIIAEDVIEQIKNGLYKATRRSYYTNIIPRKIRRNLNYEDEGVLFQTDASEYIRKANKSNFKCEGCARASIFISAVKFKNDLTLQEVRNAEDNFEYSGEGMNDSNSTTYLSDEFSAEQQALIESAFEGFVIGDDLHPVESYIFDPEDEEYQESDERQARKQTEKHDTWAEELGEAVKWGKKVVAKWNKLARPRSLSKTDYLLTQICKNIIKNDGTFKP